MPFMTLAISCFRPLAGKWFERILYGILTPKGLHCFRPLAGKWFEREGGRQLPTALRVVSVPLRGSGLKVLKFSREVDQP